MSNLFGGILGIRVFAEKLREFRESAGLSRRQLAEQMEVFESAVAKWEHGLRTPGALELAKLCRALAVPCATFNEALLAVDPPPPATLKKKRRGRPPKSVRDNGEKDGDEGDGE